MIRDVVLNTIHISYRCFLEKSCYMSAHFLFSGGKISWGPKSFMFWRADSCSSCAQCSALSCHWFSTWQCVPFLVKHGNDPDSRQADSQDSQNLLVQLKLELLAGPLLSCVLPVFILATFPVPICIVVFVTLPAFALAFLAVFKNPGRRCFLEWWKKICPVACCPAFFCLAHRIWWDETFKTSQSERSNPRGSKGFPMRLGLNCSRWPYETRKFTPNTGDATR